MCRLQITIYVMTVITVFFCCIPITAGQSTNEEESIETPQPTAEEHPTEKDSSTLKDKRPAKKGIFIHIKERIVACKNKIISYIPSDDDSRSEREFDFSTNGDDILQNFYFFAKVPFEFEAYELSLSGKYRQTFQKKDNTSDVESPSEWKTLPKLQTLSKSYAFGLELNSIHKFFDIVPVGGYFDYERDFSIEMDPHVHLSIFAETSLLPKKDWIMAGTGIWIEGQQLATTPGFRSGLRLHLEINWKNFNMMIECLPHWNFREFRLNASPELVFEFKPFGKELAFVLHGEIDYYSENTGLTVEPLFDIDPWEIRWTQLFRVPF
ncbi:MAG: hypothetical protein OXU23_03450 [Candidatus Poribacteria bacterium]|nr:hypothetical protein [Candidatus Poribacteria bacterium]